MKPDLLLADEPTSALDNIIALDVMKVLISFVDRFGILLITHETDKLSSVMSDLLSLSTSLSKIQSQLGAKKEVIQEDWDKFDGKHLKEMQNSYNKLIEDCLIV